MKIFAQKRHFCGVQINREKEITMKWQSPVLVGVAFLALLAPLPLQAGGVVEEMRTGPSLPSFGSRVDSLHSSSKTASASNPNRPAETPPQIQNPTLRAPIRVSYMASQVVISWKPYLYKGKSAVRYVIYRWTLHDPRRQMIGAVDGNVFRYIDHTAQYDVHYIYNVTGIYRIDGLYQTWNYPLRAHLELPPPESGLGCQTSTGQNPSPWWLLALVGLLLWRRPRQRA
jgi:MYXO-CTERM domain-containing protein